MTALFVLEYCLQGLDERRYGQELAGLPLVPLADGSLGVFRAKESVDLGQLQQLQNMGFSEALARRALAQTKGNLDAAVNWLFEHQDDAAAAAGASSSSSSPASSAPNKAGVVAGDRTHLPRRPGGLFARGGAGACLVNGDALPAGSAARTSSGTAPSAVPRVEPLVARVLPDLAAVLRATGSAAAAPAGGPEQSSSSSSKRRGRRWRQRWSAPVGGLVPRALGVPRGRAREVLPMLADGWPLVPTARAGSCPWPSRGVWAPTRCPATSARSSSTWHPDLLDGLFHVAVGSSGGGDAGSSSSSSSSKAVAPDEFWSYVFQPTRAGFSRRWGRSSA